MSTIIEGRMHVCVICLCLLLLCVWRTEKVNFLQLLVLVLKKVENNAVDLE